MVGIQPMFGTTKHKSMAIYGDYINGYVERKNGGEYGGTLKIEGIDISPIQAQYFKQDGNYYLWLRRKPLLEYDTETQKYIKRERTPKFEAYLKKQSSEGVFAYVGEFIFMRFKFKIEGIWDSVLGKDKKRLNLFVERLPMTEQTIINGINERKRNDKR